MGTDPKDSRLPLIDLTTVGKWSVTERGMCSDRVEHGEIIFSMTSEKALVEGCVLSEFVASEDGEGSPNFEPPRDPAAGDSAPPAAESIDYQPVVTGDHRAWGVDARAICGDPGGEQRAHHLNWLDVVGDMTLLQERAKAAQQEDLKDDGRVRATASKLLVGQNIAVETNDPSIRHGLYQLQFLYLNCEPGFSAPAGYRLEKAGVAGCVLTNYEPGTS